MDTDVSCSIIKVILKFITIVVSAAVICSIFEYTVRKIYFKLQNLYIKKSGDKHMIYEKLLVTNYNVCNGVQREHNKKLNNGLPILHKVPPKRDYGRYFCIMAEKGGTSHGGLTEKLSPFFHAKKQEVNAYGR